MSPTVVCYEGPPGTSHERALGLLRTVGRVEPAPMASPTDILATVDYTPACLGVLPIETSVGGELTATLDRLIFETSRVLVSEEVVLVESIDSFAFEDQARPETAVSHPEILDLCRSYTKEHGLGVRHAVSSSEACRLIATEKDPSLVALAPQTVAERFNLVRCDQSVLDVPDIRTKYVLIGREVAARSGDDRTSLVLTPPQDRAGVLSEIVDVVSGHEVNMLSILSRPLQAPAGVHTFHVTCEGHITDSPLRKALSDLLDSGVAVKLLGSYPAWDGPEVTTPFSVMPAASVARTSGPAATSALLDPPQRLAKIPAP